MSIPLAEKIAALKAATELVVEAAKAQARDEDYKPYVSALRAAVATLEARSAAEQQRDIAVERLEAYIKRYAFYGSAEWVGNFKAALARIAELAQGKPE